MKLTINKKTLFSELKSYAAITVGLVVFSLGLTAFLIPSDIVTGGIAGLGSLIYFATGIPVGVVVLVANIGLVLLAIQQLGMGFGIKTIYSILVMSLILTVMQQYITEPVVDDKFMAAIIGAMLTGASIGFIINYGGSTGGTDIVAMIINKYRNISPGKIYLYSDILVITSSYFLFESIELIVYGYVTVGVFSWVVDLVLTGNKASMQMFIFSKKSDELAELISNQVRRGVTIIDGKGWYSKNTVPILLVVVRKTESHMIFRMIKEADPQAFVSVSSVMGVFGEGFDEIKVKKSKKKGELGEVK
jgi:uncharacterized membrane-anchored protein YitT (DUF2179 family)